MQEFKNLAEMSLTLCYYICEQVLMALGTGTEHFLRFMFNWVLILSLPFRFISGTDSTHKQAEISSLKSRRLGCSFFDVPMSSECFVVFLLSSTFRKKFHLIFFALYGHNLNRL